VPSAAPAIAQAPQQESHAIRVTPERSTEFEPLVDLATIDRRTELPPLSHMATLQMMEATRSSTANSATTEQKPLVQSRPAMPGAIARRGMPWQRNPSIEPAKPVFIYVLLCAPARFYVGKSVDVLQRFQQHQQSWQAEFQANMPEDERGDSFETTTRSINTKGSEWTTRHKPLMILEIRPQKSAFDELTTTLEYMRIHGIDAVRGSVYTGIELSRQDRMAIETQLIGATDACYMCNSTKHFAAECPQRNLPGDSITAPSGTAAPESTPFISGQKRAREDGGPIRCIRCMRTSHAAHRCFARTHADGTSLLPAVAAP
jgi:hypothetical protein